MKKVSTILSLLILFTAMWSCDEKDNLDPEKTDEISAPVLGTPAIDASIVLNEATPDETIDFSWSEAVSTLGDPVTYQVRIAKADDTDFENPIATFTPENSGTATSVSVSQKVLDELLSYADFPANETAELVWGVEARSLTKITTVSANFSVKRFEHEIVPQMLYISGDASEGGSDVAQAIAMKRLNDAEGNPSNKYEVYTQLTAGAGFSFFNKNETPALRFGGIVGEDANAGTIQKSAEAIAVAETAEYRVVADFDANTYQLTKIEKWSVVGSPIVGEWGGDEPLSYQGAGVWKASINLISTGGFVFRANGDWGMLMKRVQGTDNQVVLEGDAAAQGVEFEDIPSENTGQYIFTLNLSATGYTYSIDKDPDAAEPLTTPEKLYLFADGTKVHEFSKEGDIFSSGIYLALQSGVEYTLNASEDGTGDSYSIDAAIGQTDNAEADKVSGFAKIETGSTVFSTERDQAYSLTFDFTTGQLTWAYYNVKLFHWQDWDGRDEFAMTYEHPYKFTVTTDLKAGYEMKFISPWDVEFGGDDASALSGTMTNKGGENIINIATDGSYTVTIEIASDYQTGSYEFVAQ